jgi:hypothetical protein
MMRVPEASRIRTHPVLGSDETYGRNGAFELPSPSPGWTLMIIASDGNDPDVPEADGWEHVSVHAFNRNDSKQRTPTWREMSFIKDTFWESEDVVMQLHPRRSQYVNQHPHTLHLWRSRNEPIPEPPSLLVGTTAGYENSGWTRLESQPDGQKVLR